MHDRRHLTHDCKFRFPAPFRGCVGGPGNGGHLPFRPIDDFINAVVVGHKALEEAGMTP